MSVCLTQEGGGYLWQSMLGIVSPGAYYVGLYASNYAPQHTDRQATYAAIELVVSGYARIELVNPSVDWSIAPIALGSESTYLTLVWNFTAACTLYGYWMMDHTQTYSIWAELFATSYVYGAGGGGFGLVLAPQLVSCPGLTLSC